MRPGWAEWWKELWPMLLGVAVVGLIWDSGHEVELWTYPAAVAFCGLLAFLVSPGRDL